MKDKFGREIDYLRISVTDNCNLRCIYCMEENHKDFLSSDKKLTDDEIYRILNEGAKLGIKKIRITGGDPLTRKGLVELVGMINSISGIHEIYMTTNGILLLENLDSLVANGLKGVNISLDSLKENRFKKVTRGGDLVRVLKAIEKCIEYNVKVKINTVIIDEINKDEIIDFVKFIRDKPIDVRFIELMPIGEGKKYKAVNNEAIMGIIKKHYDEVENVNITRFSGPAQYIRINGFLGRVGFISPITNCFCNECNRIRVTPDGFLKRCLHWSDGADLRSLLRNNIKDEDLRRIIEENIYEKPARHLFNEKSDNKELRFMNEIGG